MCQHSLGNEKCILWGAECFKPPPPPPPNLTALERLILLPFWESAAQSGDNKVWNVAQFVDHV